MWLPLQMTEGVPSIILSILLSNCEDSERTQKRAHAAGIELMPSMSALAEQCDAILSIVPPRDAVDTAKRLEEALPPTSQKILYYFDLNAIAPGTARTIAEIFASRENTVFIDGGIIGGVPFAADQARSFNSILDIKVSGAWHCPSLIVSGPQPCQDSAFSKILNIDHLNLPIGAASGLKMCFAAMTKGFYSLAIQSFATAYGLGVMPELRLYLQKYNPATLTTAEKGLVSMPPKAYRWVHEMREIGKTMSEDGGFKAEL
jgi:hypothetical protein